MSLLLYVVFLAAFAYYAVAGRTPDLGFRAMRALHGRSSGRFNYGCLRVAQLVRPAVPTETVHGFLGGWQRADIDNVVTDLDRDGIALLDRALPASACMALEAFARSTPARPLGGRAKEIYETRGAKALRYDFEESDILRSPEACTICFDGTLAAIAAAYFRCRPVYDFTAMWWTTPFGERDYAGAAQKFHWDMDRLFFLKFFVYLTDVAPETGPHVFIAGSHRSKPAALRQDRRYEDAELARHYPSAAIRSICGPRGTIFAADTRAFHKGEPVVSGERLVLQVEFAISRFGQNYRKTELAWSELRARGLTRLPDARIFPDIRPS